MEKPEAIMIKDSKTGKYFAFVSRFPSICAQGDSRDEVREKINKFITRYFKEMDDTMKNEEQEFAF